MVIRYGPQKVLVDALTRDAEDRAAFSYDYKTEYDETEDDYTEYKAPSIQVPAIPKSQLFHWYSPLKWAKVIKFEIEASECEEEKNENEDEDYGKEIEEHPLKKLSAVEFPIKTFVFLCDSDFVSITTNLKVYNFLLTFSSTVIVILCVLVVSHHHMYGADATPPKKMQVNVKAFSCKFLWLSSDCVP